MNKYTLHLDAKELEELHIALLHRKDALRNWLTTHYPDHHSFFTMNAHFQRTIELVAAIEKDRSIDDY